MITIIGHPASEPGRFVIFLLFFDVCIKKRSQPSGWDFFFFLLHDQATIGVEGCFEISFFVEFERGECGLTFFVVDVELGEAGEVR